MEEVQAHRAYIWQAGMDALIFTVGGTIWALPGLSMLFPRGGPLVPLGAGLVAALLLGASGWCLQAASRSWIAMAETGPPIHAPVSRADLATGGAIVGTLLATVVCLVAVSPMRLVPALALVTGMHVVSLALVCHGRPHAVLGIVLGGLAAATMLHVPDPADASVVVCLGSMVILWLGAALHLLRGARLGPRARSR